VIERGNLLLAEATARKLGRITLNESPSPLVARHEPARRSRFAVRWLERLLEEDERLSIEEAAVAASSLAALGRRGTTKHWRRFRPWRRRRLETPELAG
jgi:hypothetical protein